jgi:hypothetical protein
MPLIQILYSHPVGVQSGGARGPDHTASLAQAHDMVPLFQGCRVLNVSWGCGTLCCEGFSLALFLTSLSTKVPFTSKLKKKLSKKNVLCAVVRIYRFQAFLYECENPSLDLHELKVLRQRKTKLEKTCCPYVS